MQIHIADNSVADPRKRLTIRVKVVFD